VEPLRKVIVAKIVRGEVKAKEVKEGVKPEEVVKELAVKVLKDWDPKKADLIIMRHPSKELVPTLKQRFSIYVLSYKGVWEKEGIRETEIYVVMPDVGKETDEVLSLLKDYTLS